MLDLVTAKIARHRAVNEENMSFSSSMDSCRLYPYLEVCIKYFFLTRISALVHLLLHHQFVSERSIQHGHLLWIPHQIRPSGFQWVPWWTMETVCWQLILVPLQWFCTNGQLNATTLLSHSPSSKEEGESKYGWKQERLTGWDKDNTIKGKRKTIILHFPSANNVRPHLGKQDLNAHTGGQTSS